MKYLLSALLLALTFASSAVASEARRVAVLIDAPQDMQLEIGGQKLVFQNLAWARTSRGYETTISFPAQLTRAQSAMLVRKDGRGYSTWGIKEMRYLRRHDVTKTDPACLGGKGWCATRGF